MRCASCVCSGRCMAAGVSTQRLGPRDVLAIALENGRMPLGAPAGGQLAEGAAADLVLVLDRAALDEDALMPVDPLDLIFARASRRHIRELIVAGRSIVSHGRVQRRRSRRRS